LTDLAQFGAAEATPQAKIGWPATSYGEDEVASHPIIGFYYFILYFLKF
jgi:hypothetical protein